MQYTQTLSPVALGYAVHPSTFYRGCKSRPYKLLPVARAARKERSVARGSSESAGMTCPRGCFSTRGLANRSASCKDHCAAGLDLGNGLNKGLHQVH